MNFWRKFKEVGLSLLPILAIVLIIHIFFYQFSADLLLRFILACIIIAVGEVLFLTGIENSIMPMGELVGSSSGKLKNILILIFFAFIFGLFATIAEPDINVLASEVYILGFPVGKTVFMFIIGAGVGAFVALALIRLLYKISYKVLVTIILLICFVLCIFLPDSLIAVAFDSGGATTGIVTSPFLLAISSGIASSRSSKSHSDNFGVIGLTSLGPVLAIIILSFFVNPTTSAVAIESSMGILLDTLMTSLLAIIPLVAVFFIFEVLFIKLPKKKKSSLLFGSFVTFVGLYLFLFGIDYGFLEMGESVGLFLSTGPETLFLVLCLILGFCIAFTEPAVRVLSVQVEDVTQGNISRKGVMIAIAIAMMLAVFIAGLKVLFNISVFYILVIGYGLIVLLMFITPKTFTNLAFDSGGVASGPMTSAFVLPLMLGFSLGAGNAAEGFGLIAIVGMIPILVIEILGVIYRIKLAEKDRQSYRLALRISYGADAYSNMDALEEEHNKLMAKKKEKAEEIQDIELD